MQDLCNLLTHLDLISDLHLISISFYICFGIFVSGLITELVVLRMHKDM